MILHSSDSNAFNLDDGSLGGRVLVFIWADCPRSLFRDCLVDSRACERGDLFISCANLGDIGSAVDFSRVGSLLGC